jgi:hypothetical protein
VNSMAATTRTQASHNGCAKKITMQRTTVRTSRLLDFRSENEWTVQTGHDSDEGPLVVILRREINSGPSWPPRRVSFGRRAMQKVVR